MGKELQELIPHKCLRCGNAWYGLVAEPKACPDCKSRLWNTPHAPTHPLHCNQCGCNWDGKKAKPQTCPACHSRHWSLPYQPKRQHTCCFCHHIWMSALSAPKACPNCKDRNWDMQLGTWECYDCKAGGHVEEWEVTGITTERGCCHWCRSTNIGPLKE